MDGRLYLRHDECNILQQNALHILFPISSKKEQNNYLYMKETYTYMVLSRVLYKYLGFYILGLKVHSVNI